MSLPRIQCSAALLFLSSRIEKFAYLASPLIAMAFSFRSQASRGLVSHGRFKAEARFPLHPTVKLFSKLC